MKRICFNTSMSFWIYKRLDDFMELEYITRVQILAIHAIAVAATHLDV
jgi:hypothetical protein